MTEVHDLHVWTLVPASDMATAHLTSDGDPTRVLTDARAILAARGLHHATVQVEPLDATMTARSPTGTNRWQQGLRAAVAMAVPVAVGWAAGDIGRD